MASSFVHFTGKEVELLKRWQVVRPGTLRHMVCNMKRRCTLLRESGGRYFEEGK